MINQEAHILDYVGVLLRRKWLILAFAVILVGAAVLKNNRIRPRYRTTATVRVEGNRGPLAYLPESIRYGDYGDPDRTINTHLRMITSYPIIQQAVETALGHSSQPVDSNQPDPRVLAAQSAISAKPVEETNLITIECTHSDPMVAMELVNAVAQAYKNYSNQKREARIRDNVQWLRREIAQLKEKVQDSEKALHQYKKESKILSLESEKSLHLKELSEIRSDYNKIRVQRVELEAQIREIEQVLETKANYIPAFLNEELLHSLNTQLVSGQLELTRLSKHYGPRHPKIIQAQTQIQSIQDELNRSFQKAIQSRESKLRVLRDKEEKLLASMNTYKKKAIRFEGNQIRYALLDLEARSNRQLYDILVEKLKEINLIQNLQAEEVTIVEKGHCPPDGAFPGGRRGFLPGIPGHGAQDPGGGGQIPHASHLGHHPFIQEGPQAFPQAGLPQLHRSNAGRWGRRRGLRYPFRQPRHELRKADQNLAGHQRHHGGGKDPHRHQSSHLRRPVGEEGVAGGPGP